MVANNFILWEIVYDIFAAEVDQAAFALASSYSFELKTAAARTAHGDPMLYDMWTTFHNKNSRALITLNGILLMLLHHDGFYIYSFITL